MLITVQEVKRHMQNLEDARRKDEEKVAAEYAILVVASEDDIIQVRSWSPTGRVGGHASTETWSRR